MTDSTLKPIVGIVVTTSPICRHAIMSGMFSRQKGIEIGVPSVDIIMSSFQHHPTCNPSVSACLWPSGVEGISYKSEDQNASFFFRPYELGKRRQISSHGIRFCVSSLARGIVATSVFLFGGELFTGTLRMLARVFGT